MRRFAICMLCIMTVVVPALAQRGGGGGRGGMGGGGGFSGGRSGGGNMGRGSAGPGRPSGGTGYISSRPAYRSSGPSHYNRGYQNQGGSRYSNYGWGWGWGGYSYLGYPSIGTGYYGQSTYISSEPAPYYEQYAPGPQVVINQNFVEERHQPVLREVAPPPYIEPKETTVVKPSTQPAYFLIAFRNGATWLARSYWVDGGTLRYITRDNVEHEAPLTTVDREASIQLNAERQVSFSLPQ